MREREASVGLEPDDEAAQWLAEHDLAVREQIHHLDAELDHLWDEHRALRARVRFGDRDRIVARARVEERLERVAA